MEASGIRAQERQMEMKVWLPPQAQKGPGYAVKQVVGVLALVGLGLAPCSSRCSRMLEALTACCRLLMR